MLHVEDKDDTEEVGDGEEDTMCVKIWLGGGDAHTEDKGGVTDSVIRQRKHLSTFQHKMMLVL